MKKHVFNLTLFFFAFTLIFAVVSGSAQQQQRKGIFKNIVTTFRLPSPAEQKNISRRLNLTEEQRTQMKGITEKYKKEGSQLISEYNKGYEAVVRLMESTNPDSSCVNQALKDFHQVHSQLVDKEVEYWRDFKSILTLEQNKQFWNIFAKSRVRK